MRMNTARRRYHKHGGPTGSFGFTLVELLVALMLLTAAMATMVRLGHAQMVAARELDRHAIARDELTRVAGGLRGGTILFQPGGQNPDGQNPDGQNPDGENIDGENSMRFPISDFATERLPGGEMIAARLGGANDDAIRLRVRWDGTGGSVGVSLVVWMTRHTMTRDTMTRDTGGDS